MESPEAHVNTDGAQLAMVGNIAGQRTGTTARAEGADRTTSFTECPRTPALLQN